MKGLTGTHLRGYNPYPRFHKRKDTPLAVKRQKTMALKKQVIKFMHKSPGVEKAAKHFGIESKKIYQWLKTA